VVLGALSGLCPPVLVFEAVGGLPVGRFELGVGDDERRQRRLDGLYLVDVARDEALRPHAPLLGSTSSATTWVRIGQSRHHAVCGPVWPGLAVGGLEPANTRSGSKSFEACRQRHRRRPRVGGRHLAVRQQVEVVGVDGRHRLAEHVAVARRPHAHHARGAALPYLRLERRAQCVLVVRVHDGWRVAAFEVAVLVEGHLSSRKSGTPFVSVTVCIVRFAPLDRRRRRWRRRADVDAEHAVDALALVGGSAFSSDSGWSGSRPIRRRRRAVLDAGAVGDADVEVDGDVRAVDAEFLGFLDWAPDVVALVGVYLLAVLFEVRVYGHWYTVAGSPHTLKSTRRFVILRVGAALALRGAGELQK